VPGGLPAPAPPLNQPSGHSFIPAASSLVDITVVSTLQDARTAKLARQELPWTVKDN